MRSDGSGANSPQPRDPWGPSTRPPSYGGQSQPTVPASNMPYGDTPMQRSPLASSGPNDLPTLQMAPPPPPNGGPPRRRNVPTFLRPPAVWFTGIAATGMIFILVMVLAAPATPTPGAAVARATATWTPMPIPTAMPTDTATPMPVFVLPTFSDWRAAYIAADGKVHITSQDGQTDLTGPTLALNTADTTNSTVSPAFADTYQSYTSMSISPNGQYLAFIDQPVQPSGAGIAPPEGDLVIMPLVANAGWNTMRIPGPVTHIGGWSPDGKTLAYSGSLVSGGGLYTVAVPNGQPQRIPDTDGANTESAVSSAHILGWINACQLALVVSTQSFQFPQMVPGATAPAVCGTPVAGMVAPPAAQAGLAGGAAMHDGPMLAAPAAAPRSGHDTVSLAVVNVHTGEAYTIAALKQGGQEALSPDGKQVVAQNSCVGVCPDSPLVTEVISTATGATHALPTSDAAIAPTAAFVWNPQADAFAATVNTNPHTAGAYLWQVSLVDAQHDVAQAVRASAFAVGWSPDGQALVVADGSGLGSKGAKLWLVAPGSGKAPIALPQPSVAFIGFVRTSAG